MKRYVLLIGVVLCVNTLDAQTRVDLRTQGKGVDFAEATSTRPAKTGSVLPAVCERGELFFSTAAPVGKNLYGCVSTNIWSVQAPAESPGGDLSGLVNAAIVTGLQGRSVSAVTPADGQALVWNSASSQWVPSPVAASGGGSNSNVDCAVTRNSATDLTIDSCGFAFPNQTKQLISGVTITATGGGGTAYIFATTAGSVQVGRSGSLTILCTGCTDVGAMSGFPDDVAPIGTWTSMEVPGEWDASGQTDERALVQGPVQITPGDGIIISTLAAGEKQVAIDTAVVSTQAGWQAGYTLACNGSGSASVQSCSMNPVLTAYTPGMRIRFRSGATNTGALTLNIDALGATAIKSPSGTADPLAGEIAAGNYYDLTYDGVVFRLPSHVSAGAGITAARTASGTEVSIDTSIVQTKGAIQAGQEVICSGSGSASVQSCSMNPVLTVYTPGMRIRFRSGTSNTGGLTLSIDGLGATPVKSANGVDDPFAGELAAGNYYDLTYDGAVFRVPTHVSAGAGITTTRTASGTEIGIDSTAIQTRAAAQAGQEVVCSGSGSASAQTCTMNPTLTAYTPGMRIRFRSSATNTGGLTLNIDGLGATPVKSANGVDDPFAGELAVGNYYDLTYEGSVFRLPSHVAAGSGITTTRTVSGTEVSIDPTVIQTRAAAQAGQEVLCNGAGSAAAQSCIMTPPLTGYTPGMQIRFHPGTTNTGAQTLAIDGLSATAIKYADGVTNPSAGALAAGRYYDLTYDGTVFRTGQTGSAAAVTRVKMSQYQNLARFLSSSTFHTAWSSSSGMSAGSQVTSSGYTFIGFTINDNPQGEVNTHFALPSNWEAAAGITIKPFFYLGSGTLAAVGWNVATACVAQGEAANSLTFNPTLNHSVTSPAANPQQNIVPILLTGSNLGNCAAGELMHLKLGRDSTDAFSGAVALIGVEFEYYVTLE